MGGNSTGLLCWGKKAGDGTMLKNKMAYLKAKQYLCLDQLLEQFLAELVISASRKDTLQEEIVHSGQQTG